VTVIVDFSVASKTLVAVIITVDGFGTACGAVYSPASLICPWFCGSIDHVTVVLSRPLTWAANVSLGLSQSARSSYSYANNQLIQKYYECAVASSKNVWQPRLPPGLHHKAELVYECGAWHACTCFYMLWTALPRCSRMRCHA